MKKFKELKEDIHKKILNIMHSVEPKNVLPSARAMARRIKAKGEDPKMKGFGKIPKGSSRAVVPIPDHEIILDGKPAKIKSMLKIAHEGRRKSANHMLLGQHQNRTEASDHVQQYATMIKQKDGTWKTNPHGFIPPVLHVGPDHKYIHVAHADDQPWHTDHDAWREITKRKSHPKGMTKREFYNALQYHEYDYKTHVEDNGKENADIMRHNASHPTVKAMNKFQNKSGIDDFHNDNMGVWTHPHTKEKHYVMRDAGYDDEVSWHYSNATFKKSDKKLKNLSKTISLKRKKEKMPTQKAFNFTKIDEDVHPRIKKIIDTLPEDDVINAVRGEHRRLKSKGISSGLGKTKSILTRGSSRAIMPVKDHNIILDGKPTVAKGVLKFGYFGIKSSKSGRLVGIHQNEVEAHPNVQKHATMIKQKDGTWKTNPDGVVPPVLHAHSKHRYIHIGHAENFPKTNRELRRITKTDSHPNGLSNDEFWHGISEHGISKTDNSNIHPLVQNIRKFKRETGVSDLHNDNMGVWTHPHTGKKHIVVRDAGFDDSTEDHYKNLTSRKRYWKFIDSLKHITKSEKKAEASKTKSSLKEEKMKTKIGHSLPFIVRRALAASYAKGKQIGTSDTAEKKKYANMSKKFLKRTPPKFSFSEGFEKKPKKLYMAKWSDKTEFTTKKGVPISTYHNPSSDEISKFASARAHLQKETETQAWLHGNKATFVEPRTVTHREFKDHSVAAGKDDGVPVNIFKHPDGTAHVEIHPDIKHTIWKNDRKGVKEYVYNHPHLNKVYFNRLKVTHHEDDHLNETFREMVLGKKDDTHGEIMRMINQLSRQKKSAEDIAKHVEKTGKLGRVKISPGKAYRIAKLMLKEGDDEKKKTPEVEVKELKTHLSLGPEHIIAAIDQAHENLKTAETPDEKEFHSAMIDRLNHSLKKMVNENEKNSIGDWRI